MGVMPSGETVRVGASNVVPNVAESSGFEKTNVTVPLLMVRVYDLDVFSGVAL